MKVIIALFITLTSATFDMNWRYVDPNADVYGTRRYAVSQFVDGDGNFVRRTATVPANVYVKDGVR